MNTLSFFEKKTDAVSTNRGFYFQYLNTLKSWLEIYKTSSNAILYCEVEDDLKLINLDELSFSQFKCYSTTFSFSSPEIKKTFYNFYCLFFKYFDKNPQFEFYTNSNISKSEKTLIQWYNSQSSLQEDAIQQIILKLQPILEKEFDEQFCSESDKLKKRISQVDANEKLTKQKKKLEKLKLEDHVNKLTRQSSDLNDHLKRNINIFIRKISFTFLNEKPEISVNKLEEECISLITSIPNFTHIEKLFFGRLLTEIYKRSSNGEISQRLLDNNLLKTIASESAQEIEKNCNSIFLKFIQRLDKIEGRLDENDGRLDNMDNRIDNIDTRYSNQAPIPKVLSTPPFKPEKFLGREKELEDLFFKLFNEDSLILLVNGEGGIGKTSLAAEYYDKYLKDYSHAAWIFVDSQLSDALLSLTSVLRIKFDERGAEISIEDKMRELMLKLAQLVKPCLLIIDNANSLEDLNKWYGLLRTCNNFHIILTTRITNFLQAKCYSVNPLDCKAAVELFKTYYTNHDSAEDDLLNEILIAIGYNTLVIELLAKNLENFNTGLTTRYELKNLLNDIQDRGLLHLRQSNEVEVYYKDIIPKYLIARPEEIVQAMYSLVPLNENEKQLLSVFSVLPSESIPFKNLNTLLPNIENLDKSLLLLFQKGWIEYNKNSKTFKCNPIVQEVTRNSNKARISSDISLLIDSLCSNLDTNPETFNITTVEHEIAIEYVKYSESILRTIQIESEDICFLAGKVGEFFKIYGDLSKSINYFLIFLVKAIKLSKNGNLKDPSKLSNAYFLTAEAYESIGKYVKALEYYSEGLKLNMEFIEKKPDELKYKSNLAQLYGKLSEVNSKLGFFNKEDEFFKLQSASVSLLNIIESNNSMFLYNLAILNEMVGAAFQKKDDKRNTFIHFKKYYDLSEILLFSNPKNIEYKLIFAVSCNKLGDYYLLNKIDFDAATKYNDQFYDLINELSKDYPQNVKYLSLLAIACGGKGLLLMGEKPDKAIVFFKTMETILDDLSKNDPANIENLNNLGKLYDQFGQTYNILKNAKEAVQYYKKYVEISIKLHTENPKNPDFIDGLIFSHIKLATEYISNRQNSKSESLKASAALSLHAKAMINGFILSNPTLLKYKYNLIETYLLLLEVYYKQRNREVFCLTVREAENFAITLIKDYPNDVNIHKFISKMEMARRSCKE